MLYQFKSSLTFVAVVKVGDKNEHIEDDIFYMDNGKISKTVIKYKTSQFHFHWAESSTAGSEHTINGKRYSLEVSADIYSILQIII